MGYQSDGQEEYGGGNSPGKRKSYYTACSVPAYTKRQKGF